RVGLEDAASIGLVLNALGALLLLRDRVVALGSVVGAMVLVGMHSHPASASAWGEWAIVVHVVIALLWGGSLAYLVTMLRRRRRDGAGSELSGALARYARLALLSVLAIVFTGGAAALTQIGSPGELLGTTYGRLLTLKVALVAWTMLVATVGRWRGQRAQRMEDGALALAVALAQRGGVSAARGQPAHVEHHLQRAVDDAQGRRPRRPRVRAAGRDDDADAGGDHRLPRLVDELSAHDLRGSGV